MKRVENKVAIVTGASSGIGKASAKMLASEGAHVICLDVSKDVYDTVKDIDEQAEGYTVDISDEKAVSQFIDQVKEKYGRVDILLNNAGIDNEAGRIHEYPTEVFDKIISVDLRGTFLMTKYTLPLMLKNGGSIVNMSSFSGIAADLNRCGYNAAKAGVINFTHSIAIEYGRENIRANAIAPGTIETSLVDDLVGTPNEESGKKFRENQKWMTPLGRLGKPEEVANLVLFLASDESSFITGEVIKIDGGVKAYTWPGNMLSDKSWQRAIK